MKWQRILIHHTAGVDRDSIDLEEIRSYHVRERGWKDIGYHFVVERIGEHYEALMGRPLNLPGAHCPGLNRLAIGVALVGDFTYEPPPEGQLACAARLVAGLCEAFDIPTVDIGAHSSFRNTECPGKAFPFGEFLNRVNDLL